MNQVQPPFACGQADYQLISTAPLPKLGTKNCSIKTSNSLPSSDPASVINPITFLKLIPPKTVIDVLATHIAGLMLCWGGQFVQMLLN
ncbi:hypothetical protein [Microcoleus sp. D3_18a_C4]|uniref:hypothetical protein n=1 Tax=Microcoleus sp. D3_18a_C4 TaxID=3055332 RepID=UPI002FD04222